MQDILDIGNTECPPQGNDTTYDVSEWKIKLFHKYQAILLACML